MLDDNLLLALKRKKGERNLTVKDLAEEIGISRWTLDSILKERTKSFSSTTIQKLNDWLYQQI